ncbi:3,4-dihydroxy-2-butanone-4-phosphate synthase [Vibrio sp. SS-MA-C1-2]|uniref:3,4-dihydroxy-2-butanone-4-phosphate synthase n=1 Tax=Vibrio sp. SS-MA-C1-2 TaxID=2908646 RepID=UPI001F014B4D|nr:3,4-dihydroxy-2-butanone-4-phosphate synthase [Vibrio sp. SS-MA-C1-2]UJF18488.1 3,4-dihydroxy-2-butanone-4-phosphate synthase [Vibrio sp. SS-MA-C1-2]
MSISSIEEVIEDYKKGKMVILMDDEDRENEGDIMIAAEYISAEHVNFMATHGRGLICLTITQDKCQNLGLGPMVKNPTEPWSTAFTVSIEAAEGVTTGISADDRSKTIQAATAVDATPLSIVQPGHIFPLVAKDGGVLVRAGHTEAGCDLARIADCQASSVIVEILNEDGTMARRPQLEVFAAKHGIKLGTIADLIEYRNKTEKTIKKISESKITTPSGEFNLISYLDTIDSQIHHALIKGDVIESPTNVRVHVSNTLNDLLHIEQNNSQSWPLQKAINWISKNNGVIVLINPIDTTDSLIKQVKDLESKANSKYVPHLPSRMIGIGSQILSDLGVTKMNLLSSADKKYHSLSGFGLEVNDYIEYN